MEAMNSFVVRYAETDQMGIVHHSNYPVWFEAGRTEYFRKVGISYSEIERKGYLLPLTDMSVTFKSPARYEEEITIVTRLVKMTCVRVEFEYEVLGKYDGRICAIGKTSHAWTNKELKPLDFKGQAPEIFLALHNGISTC